MTQQERKKMQIEKIDKLRERLMEIYVLFYLCIFPMAMHNKYFDILKFRFRLFWIPTLVFTLVFIVIGLYRFNLARKLHRLESVKSSSKSNHQESTHAAAAKTTWQRIKTKFTEFRAQRKITNTDIWFTLLFLEMGVSTLLAPYKYEAIWGNRGRYQGFLLWALFYAAYLMVTRFYQYKERHIYIILFFSLAPCVLGIIQFFTYDPFDFFSHTDAKYRYIYASTIGNINTYSAYTAMMMALSTVLFTISKDKKLEITAGILMLIHMFAHVMSISDNTILSTAALFAALPFLAWKEDSTFIKSICSSLIFLLAMIVTGGIYQTGMMTMNQYGESILIAIGCMPIAKLAFAVLILLVILFIIIKKKKGKLMNEKGYAKIRKIWMALLIIGFVTVIGIFIYANAPSNAEKIQSLPYQYQKVLILNDQWGTGRIFVWRLAFQYYFGDSTIIQKIFGNGLDTLYILMMDRYRKEMIAHPYGIYDNVHNEYIEYLMTIGIVGLIFYLGLIITALKTGFYKKNKVCIACTTAALLYIVQAAVNIPVPIVTPIFILLFSIGNSLRLS